MIPNYFRSYYWDSGYRHIIQFDPKCAVYDSQVFYRLRPGECLHSGLRFENNYSINSLGVRDDEKSLAAPEIISIGDSHAMGWGVDQQDTYSQIIERQTGMLTLNMGVSSFGTIREMIMLNRADLSKLKYLIIQYDDNDVEENKRYLDNGCRLKINSRQEWEYQAEQEESRRRYYPGAHFAGLIRYASHRLKESAVGRVPPSILYNATEHANIFLAVLASFHRPELQKAQILVFDVRNKSHSEPSVGASFAQALALLKENNKYKQLFNNRMTVLDLASNLNRNDYRHIIDNHINKDGHQLVAKAILEYIKHCN